jgi:chorismate-pyruvate lyase
VKNPQTLLEAPLLPLELWAPAAELLRSAPHGLRAALAHAGPLSTDGGAPAARLIEQRLGFLSGEQQRLLAVTASSCLVRDELLGGAGPSRVFVAALLPDATLELHPWLAELGDAALGTTLRAAGALEHGPLELAPLPASHPLAARALAGLGRSPALVWARRSWYALRGRRLLMHELLLPEPPPC